ncbi:carbamoyl-phosphate synthase subunit L [Prosthecochloris sp. GSB1]|uniref:acetyl-CoA carboxylase biotin carboxylase subunit n=1 Tax=Prosthecochloris sp. GSB1 TaxID=281093 RepID=UPI000B8C73F3|nr:biotin carboxylase N-terminal domain-containing protein [Prosthecochloris sp. GSB1]ASQ91659.1 carbamoyl-phosphate synthase subunit L [Prosthecochloris sp. GSB1]
MNTTIRKVLVANRGVPAVRVIQTCRDRKIPTTAVYSTPDRLAAHVFMATDAVHIGEAPPLESYLNMEKIIQAARTNGANAVHPGWGFLSENAVFAGLVRDSGLLWIGPDPEVIQKMGDKIESKKIAREAGVPTVPGIDSPEDSGEIRRWMKDNDLAFPIMIKASSGGGGKGMVKVGADAELEPSLARARSEAKKSFGNDGVLVEKYIEKGRHIEVQIIADRHGNVIHLFERECTLQRRNQKIIEEAPSPSIDDEMRRSICDTAVRLMRAIGYSSAGTVEFLFDSLSGKFYFLEVNTRLQVEHGITELVTGVDIVGLMLDIAQGSPLNFMQEDIRPNRWALEVRLNAENPATFSPSFGTISRMHLNLYPGLRVSQGVYEGFDIPPYYDSLMMLLMTAGPDRETAIMKMDSILCRNLRVEGVETLAPLLLSIIRHPDFLRGDFSTRFIEEHLDELVSMFPEEDSEEEALKIARYVTEISALGTPNWM